MSQPPSVGAPTNWRLAALALLALLTGCAMRGGPARRRSWMTAEAAAYRMGSRRLEPLVSGC